MKNFEHYKRGYYMPPEKSTKWVEKEYVADKTGGRSLTA